MNLSKILNSMQNKNILVIGDLMLDKYVEGSVTRISQEAPVQVIKVESEHYTLGGCANTANNIISLNSKASIIGVIGNDHQSEILLNELAKKGINTDGLIKDHNRPTTQKVRYLSKNQQLIRADYEKTHYIDHEIENKLIKLIKNKIPEYDAIIISDYLKGSITKNLAKGIISTANQHNKPILVDTKPVHLEYYKDITLLKPNLKEAIEMTNEKDINKMGKILIDKINASILITRGKEGMSLFLKNGESFNTPTKAKDVYDVSGAGDTALATFSLALCSNASMEESLHLANIASGLVVEKRGVIPINFEDLKHFLKNHTK